MCEGRLYVQVKNRIRVQNLRAGPAPTQLLKASSDGAVTAETGREFLGRIVEGTKELL